MTGIVLREWRLDDAPWYAASVRDPEIQRYTTEPVDLSAERVAAAITALAGDDDAEGYLIADAESGERLGNIAIGYHGAAADVSYWIAASGRGRGAATSALRQICALAFARCDTVRLWTHADNLASQRVALAAGFRRDPERDSLRTVKDEQWPALGFVLDAISG